MKRLLGLFALLPALLALNSCGGSGATAATPTISVSGAVPSVNVNGTVQFTAAILNLSSTLVNWQVNGVASGNSSVGTIDTAGLYKAPASVPTNNVVTITAVAQAQTTLTGTAQLTILPAAAISGVTCVNQQQQSSQTVASGQSLLCTPTVGGGGNVSVFWFVNNSATCSSTLWQTGALGGNSTLGTITGTQQGNYVAPQIPPPGATIAITAVSRADSTQAFCIPINLTFGSASLKGSYAFSAGGRVIAGNSFFARAGSFTADGSGRIIGGLEDSNQSGTVRQQRSFTGSYSVEPDGRGAMQFCEDITAACTAGASTAFFRIAVVSAQQAQIIEFGSPTTSTALTTAGGEIDLQDSSIFSAGNGNLAGFYSFNFAGVSSSSAPQSEVGVFTADGNGLIIPDTTSTPGVMEINNSGPLRISGSSYSISANGRGTASIAAPGGPFTYSFYMVSASRAKFVETDSSAILVGDAFKQQTSSSSWGVNALNGITVFETGGTGPSGGIGDLVSFTATNDGTNGTFTDGSIDENSGGTVSSAQSLSGTYTINSRGGGTLSIPGHSYVFYMISVGKAVIQEVTSGVVAHGIMVQPQGGPFTAASLNGSYALNLAGTNAAGAASKEEDSVGRLTSSGAGTVTSGSFDTNNFGATHTGVTEIGTYTTVAANGRFTMLLNPTLNFVLYFVSPTQVFALDTDATQVASGSLYKQF